MKKLKLNHQYTPAKLAVLNSQIGAVLDSEELDDLKLRTLIEERDQFIVSHLKSMETQEEIAFAECELVSNNALSKLIEKQLSDSLKQLSGLLRGKKAVNKYK